MHADSDMVCTLYRTMTCLQRTSAKQLSWFHTEDRFQLWSCRCTFSNFFLFLGPVFLEIPADTASAGLQRLRAEQHRNGYIRI